MNGLFKMAMLVVFCFIGGCLEVAIELPTELPPVIAPDVPPIEPPVYNPPIHVIEGEPPLMGEEPQQPVEPTPAPVAPHDCVSDVAPITVHNSNSFDLPSLIANTDSFAVLSRDEDYIRRTYTFDENGAFIGDAATPIGNMNAYAPQTCGSLAHGDFIVFTWNYDGVDIVQSVRRVSSNLQEVSAPVAFSQTTYTCLNTDNEDYLVWTDNDGALSTVKMATLTESGQLINEQIIGIDERNGEEYDIFPQAVMLENGTVAVVVARLLDLGYYSAYDLLFLGTDGVMSRVEIPAELLDPTPDTIAPLSSISQMVAVDEDSVAILWQACVQHCTSYIAEISKDGSHSPIVSLPFQILQFVAVTNGYAASSRDYIGGTHDINFWILDRQGVVLENHVIEAEMNFASGTYYATRFAAVGDRKFAVIWNDVASSDASVVKVLNGAFFSCQ